MKLVAGIGSPKDGACAMSLIAWISGEQEWTDQPQCVCPTIRRVAIALNDRLPSDAERERVLGPLIYGMMGTNDPTLYAARARVCAAFAKEQSAADAAYAAATYAAKAAANADADCRRLLDLLNRLLAVGECREVPQVRAIEQLPAYAAHDAARENKL